MGGRLRDLVCVVMFLIHKESLLIHKKGYPEKVSIPTMEQMEFNDILMILSLKGSLCYWQRMEDIFQSMQPDQLRTL